MPDKILVTNCAALQKKYGDKGMREVLGAVRDLIAADKARGMTTQLVDISDKGKMKAFKRKAVTSPGNERECKDAVDAIYESARPDFLVLVDGPDVVSHLMLNNPTPGDGDAKVPSDLPYASDAPYTSRDASKYASVTRVVGRIPGVTGANKPDFLVKQLKAAAAYKSRTRADYLEHFAISAQVWNASTELSVQNIFGSDAIKDCPPIGSPKVRKLLSPLSHFINCHGAEADPKFYGQKGSDYPVAMASEDVAAGAKRNAMIAAECCYGAQLFDPIQANNELPIANTYLDAGAIAFLGSTTIAYGPAEGNGAADLLTQYFMIGVLEGATFGRAFMEARQKFVREQKMEDQVNLKTLAQFILLCDASLRPCQDVGPVASADSKVVDMATARKARRVESVAAGHAAADCSGFPGKKVARPPRSLHDAVRALARKRGFRMDKQAVSFFHVVGGARYGSEMKARGVEQKVALLVERRPPPAKARKGAKENGAAVPHARILVAHMQNNRVTQIAEYVSR